MIQINGLSKSFMSSDGKVEALKNVTLTVPDGEIYGIIGMSGAGKSTLVRCINMLERPTEGSVVIDGKNLGTLSDSELRTERKKIAMIFQSFNLLQQKNCLKNICFPMELSGIGAKQAKARAEELLATVGLKEKAKAYPSQLSGGQQQRVAIARALATNPKVLLCDEATSALDPQTTNSILSLLREINERLGITIIIITHQMSVVESVCSRVAILDNGEVAEEGRVADVFSSPKSNAARRLVYPDGYDGEGSKGEKLIRVVFNGAASANSPIIARMAIELNIEVNVTAASTKTIGGRVYGNMLLSLPNNNGDTENAMKYLKSIPDIIAEEVNE